MSMRRELNQNLHVTLSFSMPYSSYFSLQRLEIEWMFRLLESFFTTFPNHRTRDRSYLWTGLHCLLGTATHLTITTITILTHQTFFIFTLEQPHSYMSAWAAAFWTSCSGSSGRPCRLAHSVGRRNTVGWLPYRSYWGLIDSFFLWQFPCRRWPLLPGWQIVRACCCSRDQFRLRC